MNSGREPSLTTGLPDMSAAPMLSKRNFTRLGDQQIEVMRYLNTHEETDVPLIEVWRLIHKATGYYDRSIGLKLSSAKSQRYYRWTNARLAAMLSSLYKRGLIVVVKHADDPDERNSYVRSLVRGHDFGV